MIRVLTYFSSCWHSFFVFIRCSIIGCREREGNMLMTTQNEPICRVCGNALKYYDSVLRIVRSKARRTSYVRVPRFFCPHCGEIHRQLPKDILPYKQYEAELIRGVLEGYITPETLGCEDYPCEMTMIRWKASSQKLQVLL